MSGKATGLRPSQPERQKVRHSRKELAWGIDEQTERKLSDVDVEEMRMERKILRKNVRSKWWIDSGMKVLVDLMEGEGEEMLQ